MRAKALFSLICSILAVFLTAQPRFSVDDSVRLVAGGTSWGVIHHFIQANNHLGDTLEMRWRKTVKGNPPSAWVVNFDDPESNHPDISGIDSVDFIFPDSASNYTYNKFVIGIDPHGAVGLGEYIFTIFERQFPADSLRITYKVEVFTGLDDTKPALTRGVFPNPACDFVYLPSLKPHGEVSLHALNGTRIPVVTERGQNPRINVAGLPDGNYLLRIKNHREILITRLMIRRP